MDQNNQPGAMPQPQTPIENRGRMENGHKKVGPIIATLIIVLVLIIAALYLFASRVNQPAPTEGVTMQTTNPTDATANTQSVEPVTNTSDDPQAMQNDLNASTNGLDNQNF